jgi:hypothetical protein
MAIMNPLIQQSGTRISRSALRRFRQDAATKGTAGPVAVQAFAEGETAAEAKVKSDQARLSLAAAQERERLQESQRQFTFQAGEARKARKAQEKSFFDGILGS